MKRNNHGKLNIEVLSLICTITAVVIIIIQTSFEINNDFLNDFLGSISILLLLIGLITSILVHKKKKERNIFSKISLAVSCFVFCVTLILILLTEIYHWLLTGKL